MGVGFRGAGALSLLVGDNYAALSAFEHAILVNPNFGLAFGHRALVLAYLNRPDEAIRLARQAIRLSPLDPAMFAFCSALALAHLAAGRYEEGLHWADEALRENSGMPAFRLKLSLCGHLERLEEAAKCLRQIREFYAEPTIASLAHHMPTGLAPRSRRG
jgi:tetratricopeptide (TPR) repeat protein